jgi:2-iminobutanoate/2-iminopropanoate deaminase
LLHRRAQDCDGVATFDPYLGLAMRQEFSLADGSQALSHYTDAVRFNDLLFISGVVARDAANNIVAPGDVVGQADFILATMGKILALAGAGFADVLRVTVYLRSIEDRTLINGLRQQYFGAAKPASTLIEVSALALPGLLIEIEAVAGIPRA